jgi:hypothetical protein
MPQNLSILLVWVIPYILTAVMIKNLTITHAIKKDLSQWAGQASQFGCVVTVML